MGRGKDVGDRLFKVHDKDIRTTNTRNLRNKHLFSDNLISHGSFVAKMKLISIFGVVSLARMYEVNI